MIKLPRRTFLGSSLLAGASASLSARSWGQVPGANGDVRVAIVGLYGKGKDHVASFRGLPGVRVVALCDVDRSVLDPAAAALTANGASVQTFVDYRELLARPDIDAVSIVTPNHQHAVQAVWALQAGKDVFLEKPVSHDLWEGQQLLRAAQRYERIVQVGVQNRSSPAIAEAIAWQREGHIGKITVARALCYKRRESIGKTKGPQPLPPGVDYDLWLGPAPRAPLRRTRFHYDWHWQWATGNGDIGNQGNHQLDVARRFLGEALLPPRVRSVGGRFGYVDDGETPNTMIAAYEYANAPLLFELRGLPSSPAASTSMDEYRGLSVGNIIDCEGGYISVPSRDYSSAQAFDRTGRLLREFKGHASHYENFIRAVRSRRSAELNAPLKEGHISSALAHLANISLRIGQQARPREVSEPFAEALSRMQEHLQQNQVDLIRTPLRHGALLSLDPSDESFLGEHAAAARRWARTPHRKPFVLPDLA
ncbi:MAG: Inositol 2-dehydrogenase [Pseudomonadota bacterium]